MSEKERFTPEHERKIITLDDIMDSSRQVPEEYQRLILAQEQYARGNYLGTRFVDQWHGFDEFPHARDFLKQRLAGDILVDLGGRTGSFSLAYHQFGVATYINVDRDYDGEKLNYSVNPLAALNEADIGDLHKLNVKADMLDFVARMRDGSANFMLNGIDFASVPGGERYHEALAQELVRATKPGGLVFGINATVDHIWRDMRDKAPLSDQSLDLPSVIHDSFVYQKPE